MEKHVIGIYSIQSNAQRAAQMLKENPDTTSVSFMHKSLTGSTDHSKAKEDVATGATAGGASGTALGVALGVASQTATVTLPASTLIVFGPLAPALGIVGAATGAAIGSLAGALIDFGLSESIAKQYEDRLLKGETLVGTKIDESAEKTAVEIMQKNNADLVEVITIQD